MNIFKKKVISVSVENIWSTTWNVPYWFVIAHYENRLLGFIKWEEKCEIAGPYNDKRDAKHYAKRLRDKYHLKY